MNRRIALKRLTASDLTLFRHHFENRNAGNQKAINLNADVLVKELYPDLPVLAVAHQGKLKVDLLIYGPGLSPQMSLTRKIIKHGTYKNWRLDGEMIENPQDDAERFNVLQPDDVAVIEFEGHPLPSAVRLVLLAGQVEADTQVLLAVSGRLGSKKMVQVDASELSELVPWADVPEEHPARILESGGEALEMALEDLARGGLEGQQLFRKPGARRKVSAEELERAKESASRVGRLGEELVQAHLIRREQAGELSELVWDADADATSPFDFSYEGSDGRALVEVKSTNGEFSRRIHISSAELIVMASGDAPCHLFRLCGVREEGAVLRICLETARVATEILRALDGLPRGVKADSVSVDPEIFDFGKEISVEPLDD